MSARSRRRAARHAAARGASSACSSACACVELGGNLAQPALHRGDGAPEREILVARRQGQGPDALAAEDGLHLLGRAPRSHDHATDRVGVDADRHEHEAIAELCPQSLAQ